MKVETDVRAGGYLEDASSEAASLVQSVNSLVNEATAEAQSLVNNANRASTSVWNCLSNSLNW